MARYRRTSLTDGDRLAASAVSVLVGAGAALATYYLTRLMLSREELPGRRASRSDDALVEESTVSALGAGEPGRGGGSGRAGDSGRTS